MCKNCDALCSASESRNKVRTLDLPFSFRLKHMTSLKDLPSLPLLPPSESLPHWFQDNFAAMFVLNYWLRDFPLYAVTNRFELRCEPKQLMLLYYKICLCCPCFISMVSFRFARLSFVKSDRPLSVEFLVTSGSAVRL